MNSKLIKIALALALVAVLALAALVLSLNSVVQKGVVAFGGRRLRLLKKPT